MANDELSAGASHALAPALYLVGTPIGNLEDITLRALRVLKASDLIACEDTRQTQKLLNHFEITTRTISYHEHNERTRAEELVAELKRGLRIALVSDAGTPGISDPGHRIVLLAAEHGIPIVPIPGAAAFLCALVASGLPTDNFEFSGFLPAKQGQRREALEKRRTSPLTQIFYEAPHRILHSLQDVVEILGPGRRVVVAREITKIYEEFLRGPAAEVLHQLTSREEVRGEITLLIGKAVPSSDATQAVRVRLRQRVAEIMTAEKIDEKAALKKAAKERGISKSEAYREMQRYK